MLEIPPKYTKYTILIAGSIGYIITFMINLLMNTYIVVKTGSLTTGFIAVAVGGFVTAWIVKNVHIKNLLKQGTVVPLFSIPQLIFSMYVYGDIFYQMPWHLVILTVILSWFFLYIASLAGVALAAIVLYFTHPPSKRILTGKV